MFSGFTAVLLKKLKQRVQKKKQKNKIMQTTTIKKQHRSRRLASLA